MTDSIQPRANPSCLGHDKQIQTFERAIGSNRLPHAWALIGPPGIGKATAAFALARRLLNKDGENPDDPQSAIFRQIAQSSHPDLIVLERRSHPKTGKMQSEIVVDAVRETIDAMHRTTAWSGRRILLIDTIDDLNRNAENALLKILEEPLPGTVILLVCNSPGSVPRTILSRCAQLNMRAPEPAIGEQILADAFTDSSEIARNRWLTFADNAPGRAIQCHEHKLINAYDDLLKAALSDDPKVNIAFKQADKLAKLASEAGITLAVQPMIQLCRRAARTAGGEKLDPSLLDHELAGLEALTNRLPLEHWLGMWDKLATLPGRIEGLNLDPHTMLFSSLRALFGDEVREMAI